MAKLSHETGESSTLKERVIKELKKNPLLTAKSLCAILKINYKKHGKSVANIKSNWKYHLKFGLSSKAQTVPSFHNARGWVYVDKLNLDREAAKIKGWIQSKSKNRALIWKDKLGRMEWFETGRVNMTIYPLALKGRVWQLFCNGFSHTGLIDSFTILQQLLKSIRLKSAHAVFQTTQKLPYMIIDLFKDSNGIIIKSGDLTHPNAIEVHFCYPDWAEMNERLLAEIYKILHPSKPEPSPQKPDRFYDR